MSNPSITADKTPWYQWDTGLTVTVSGGEMNECHFANRKQGTAYVQAVINGVARVPDELLQVAAPVKAYGYVSDGAGGQTYIEDTFEVIARNIPSDYTYTKTAQKTIRDAEAARDEAVQAAKDAKASELAADDSSVEASNSAHSAGESASAAATSASNAAKSAGEAAKSASDAKDAAGTAVADASEMLNAYVTAAEKSATNASTSASNAADAASAASGSASAAEQSATDASSAKVAAQTAKAGAEAAKSEASASASNAAASATAAAQSASNAAASVNAINVIAPKTVNVPASSSDQFDIAIGQNANTTANQSIAIGVTSTASHLASIALGSFSETSKDYELSLGRILENGADSTREITHVSTPTEPTSAPNKKYTDDNDAKTLSEAKKYTDANTSNALVGTVSGKLLHVEDAWPGKPLGLTIDGAYKQDGTPSPDNPVPITVIENPVLKVTGSDTSAAGTSLTITLPAEHPYLAALPDGTHDEIVIDKYGNASLIARVGKSIIPETNINVSDELHNGSDGTSNRTVVFGSIVDMRYGTSLSGVSSMFVNGGNTQNRDTIRIGYGDRHVYLYTVDTNIIGDGSADAVNAWIRANQPIIIYPLATQVTYNLGKLDIPSLPETISNVWIEATLTPEMSMTYKKDVNIIIADLTAQLAALKGTNDIVHDDSSASQSDATVVLDNSDTLDVTDTTIA